jgi:hypothetical protein
MTSKPLHRIRELLATGRRTTVAPSLLALGLAAGLLGCGGGGGGAKRTDTYARGTQVQEQCCEHLQGADRDQCLQKIVRVGDPDVAKSDVNQQQYACVVEHFVCDPASGHATQQSAQAQMDCIQDLK